MSGGLIPLKLAGKKSLVPVHGIVTGMKGEIQVYSEPGKGTQFNVYMPIVKNMKEQQIHH